MIISSDPPLLIPYRLALTVRECCIEVCETSVSSRHQEHDVPSGPHPRPSQGFVPSTCISHSKASAYEYYR